MESNADPTISTADGVSAYTIARDSKRLVNAAIILEASVIRGMLNDDPDLVLKGVKDGAYVNIRSTGGWNPLIYASSNGYLSMSQELISLGANVNHVENEGWSALHFAAINGHAEVVDLLLKAGADTELLTLDGHNAREMAETQGFDSIMKAIDEASSSSKPEF